MDVPVGPRLAAILVLATVTGCGGTGEEPADTQDATPPATSVDHGDVEPSPADQPPLAFEHVLDLGVDAHHVVGNLVWGVTGDFDERYFAEAWDITTGEQVGAAPLPPEGVSSAAFTQIDGALVVVTAEGSTPERASVRVEARQVGLGLAGSELAWSEEIMLDDSFPRIVATSPDYIAIRYLVDRTVHTTVHAAATGELLHESVDYFPLALDGDVLIGWELLGGGDTRLHGRDASTGEVSWDLPENGQAPLSPDETQRTVPLGDGYLFHAGWIIDMATGELLLQAEGASYCRHDGQGVLLCGQADEDGQPAGDFVAAWDLHTGEQLWTLRDLPNLPAVLPAFGAVYRGAVYMMSSPDQPAPVLNARTGQPLAETPEVMHEVGPGYGIHFKVSDETPLDWRSPAPGLNYAISVFRATR